MVRLAAAFRGMGFAGVKTLLASGNVLFEARGERRRLARTIEAGLERALGHEVGIIVRSLQELRRLVESQPFRGIRVTPRTRLFVTFLAERPKSRLKVPYISPDKSFRILRVSGGEVCSVLTLGPQWSRNLRQMDILEKEFGKRVTTRSWNTVLRVVRDDAPVESKA